MLENILKLFLSPIEKNELLAIGFIYNLDIKECDILLIEIEKIRKKAELKLEEADKNYRKVPLNIRSLQLRKKKTKQSFYTMKYNERKTFSNALRELNFIDNKIHKLNKIIMDVIKKK